LFTLEADNFVVTVEDVPEGTGYDKYHGPMIWYVKAVCKYKSHCDRVCPTIHHWICVGIAKLYFDNKQSLAAEDALDLIRRYTDGIRERCDCIKMGKDGEVSSQVCCL